ncbi:hypothetical protein N431DRAFT_550590 [Stipitochalara longipes BDJ]|nr:hypothetical protein N431DRAFT_550590 [Stipitochalara longipes BDJ]
MPASSPSTAASTDRIKRRRVTTACTICRDRRIKCDRTRPSCSQCKKGGKNCMYFDDEAGKVEFVDETPALALRPGMITPPLPDTWGSVIEHQVEIVKKANNGNNEVPVWAVAEAEEPTRVQALQKLQPPLAHVIPLSAFGEEFALAVINHMPSRETCQPFFEHFIFSIYPIVPVCHIRKLQLQYDDFWPNLSRSYSAESLALVIAVLYTGAVNSNVVDIESCSTLLQFWEKIFNTIDFAGYHARNIEASLHILQSYIIMNTFRASHLSPYSAFGFLPTTIRFAQSLRLHVDKKTGDPICLEIRRRMWWHLLFLDVESTIATGLPPIIHRSGYTTQLPSCCNDDNIAPRSSPSDPGDSSPIMIAMQGHYEWTNRMQTWFETLPSQHEVSKFKVLITTLLDLIPDTKQPENEWARTYLKMQVDRAYCMLGLRFWQLDQYKGTGCHSEVVQTARSFLTHYLHLSTLPSSPHLVWFTTGLIQPLHAIVILLMHLSTCTNIAEEEHLSRSLLDQIMSLRVTRIRNENPFPIKDMLCGNDRLQRTNARYLIMVELRRRVWKKIGWDCDGKGVDPWWGRLDALVKGDNVVGGGEAEVMPNGEKEGTFGMDMTAPDPLLNVWNGEWNSNETTGLEELDSILAGDPMDMFQWDEWESIASDFFAS